MPAIEILSNAPAKGIRTSLLLLSLLTLIWRVSDLIEEAIVGTPKMTMGTWFITGVDAAVIQIVIIAVLSCIVFIAYSHMRQTFIAESKCP